MNTAKLNILKDTFEQEFDLDRFKRFTREFFNEPEMLQDIRRTGIWKEYQDYINSYYTIAKYTDAEDNGLIVVAVELKRNISVDRARSMQRNFISKILDENNLEAAIVAFYAENEPSWRLSFVRLDYSFNDKGIDLDLTPAKRYSYLLGENEPNHTAQVQLLDIFAEDRRNPTLNEIEEAFSVEKVTKEFFAQYKNKYLDLKEYLESDNSFKMEAEKLGFEIEKFSEQFAKKLMGQLAFLYFLQKKGWLGVKLVPKTITKQELSILYNSVDEIKKVVLQKVYRKTNETMYELRIDFISSRDFTEHEAGILSDIFVNNEKYDESWGDGYKQFIRDVLWLHCRKYERSFFIDYLEPFFYEALNKKRKNHYFKIFNCKIPFLNGGLFEPMEGYNWKDIKFNIPNEFFSNEKEKGREADGILDIFDRFNFTMNEAEPLEKEVAVDPEMLGKIFENLLDVTDRKSKGAFYTPREIVHYMCQESIINYLVNEVNVPYEDMKEFILYGEIIRDADGRRDVGYGRAFTIKQSVLDNIAQIDEALENVKVADPAVGSGAFPLGMLNEIVRARNNITEYIIRKDKEGSFDKGRVYGEEYIRKWRSTYSMKWKTIKNSIFAVDIEPSAVDITKLRLWLSVAVEQEIDAENPEPHPLPNLDMNIHVGNSLIDEYEGIKLFDESILMKKDTKKRKKVGKGLEQLKLLFDSDEILKEMFDKQSQYFDETNEDNKKALKSRIDTLRDELIAYKLRESGNKKALDKYNAIKTQRSKPYFIWELEFAKVFQEKGGFDIVIGNPPYGAKLSNEIQNYYRNSYDEVKFKIDSYVLFIIKTFNLIKLRGVCSFIIPNTILNNYFLKDLRKTLISSYEVTNIINFKDNVFEAVVHSLIIQFIKSTPKKDHEICMSWDIDKNIDYLKQSIFTETENYAFEFKNASERNFESKIKKNSIRFEEVIDLRQAIKSGNDKIYIVSSKLGGNYKKILRGKDIGKYTIKDPQLFLNYGKHLACPRDYKIFEQPHILIREAGKKITATIDYNNFYIMSSIYCGILINPKFSLEYILGLLNSSLFQYLMYKINFENTQGAFTKAKIYHYNQLPIKDIDIDIQNNIKNNVQKILELTNSNEFYSNQKEHLQKQDLKLLLEQELDEIIYKIYNLSDTEINVIKNHIQNA